MKKSVIGIAIGGSKTAVSHAFYNGDFSNIRKIVFPTKSDDKDDVMNNIYKAIKELDVDFDFISVICGGPLDIKEGLIINPPHLPGFNNYPIVKVLNDKYHCPVSLLNDADACALAEYKLGAGRGSHNMAYLTFGTGLGAGLIINNQLYTGNNGMAGEIGHVRLNEDGPIGYNKKGTVEGYCAGENIALWAKDYIKDKETKLHQYDSFSVKEIAKEAQDGDIVSKDILDIAAMRLGQTISILIDILNLDTVVIGGIYPRIENLLKEPLIRSVEKESIKENYKVCKIVPSLLKEEIDEYSSLIAATIGDEDMKTLFDRYPELEGQRENIESAINALEKCFKSGGKILVCGNGGSASDASHIVAELMKGFLSKRPLDKELSKKINREFAVEEVEKLQLGIPCIDLGAQVALNTAFMNDVDPKLIFAQQVVGYSRNSPNDVVIGLSTSGNSKNVVNAIKVAKSLGLTTIALTGDSDNQLSKLSTICIKAPSKETYRAQEYHLPIYHYICMELEKKI